MIVVGHIDAWEMPEEMGSRLPLHFNDLWRTELDKSYNPRHVPAIRTAVSFEGDGTYLHVNTMPDIWQCPMHCINEEGYAQMLRDDMGVDHGN